MIQIPRIGRKCWWISKMATRIYRLSWGAPLQPDTMPPWGYRAWRRRAGYSATRYRGRPTETCCALTIKRGGRSEVSCGERSEYRRENNETHTVKADRTKTIIHNETSTVKIDRTEFVDGKHTETIKGNRNITVTEGDQSLTVKTGKREVTVETGTCTETVEGNITITSKPGRYTLPQQRR